MPADVGCFWDALAPLAVAEGTLVPATALEFLRLCELAVVQAAALTELTKAGVGSRDGISMSRVYLGLTQRLDAMLKSFRLAPMGRPISQPDKAKPKSAFERLKDQRSGLHAVR